MLDLSLLLLPSLEMFSLEIGKISLPLLGGLTKTKDYVVEQDARNSAVPLLDKRNINARIQTRRYHPVTRLKLVTILVIMMGYYQHRCWNRCWHYDWYKNYSRYYAIVGKIVTVLFLQVWSSPLVLSLFIGDNVLIGANAVVIGVLKMVAVLLLQRVPSSLKMAPENVVVAGVSSSCYRRNR